MTRNSICCAPGPAGVALGGLVIILPVFMLLPALTHGEDLPGDPASVVLDVDLRPMFGQWELGPRGQGSRATCSVFAVTAAIEYAVARRSGGTQRLSVEFLNWASNDAMGERADGGFFSDLWTGFQAHGICGEADWPYRDKFDPHLAPSERAQSRAREVRESGLRMHWIKAWNPTTGLSEDEFDSIRRVLRRHWPVCAGLRWPKAEIWQQGVLAMAPPEGVRDGHSVLLIGYEEGPQWPGGGRFRIRNSAGEGGDGFMTYEYARAYMNDAVWIDGGAERATAARLQGGLVNLLESAPFGRNRRASSNQQPGWNSENLDMDWLLPGASVEMPLLEGPGLITHVWLTSHAGWVGELNALTLRIYWDGREQPGVEVPVGDFFAVGQGKPASVESIPVQVSPSGSLTCFWRMPFQKSARIVVTNDNPDRSTGLYWQVNWTELDEVPDDTPYFHARYRCEYPAAENQDYLIADLEGQGHYVGTVFSVTLGQDGWFGEGDDFFCIDGEEIPSLQGTGAEDYFNDAWGFRVRTGPWFGQPRWQGNSAGDSGVCYRWHVPDPIHFLRSLRVEIEHKGNRPEAEDGFFLERPDFVSSVAFWYQTGTPKPFAPIPSWHERRVPWRHQHLLRVLRQASVTGDVSPEIQTQGFFGARPVMSWLPTSADASLALPFTVERAGRHAIRLTAAHGPDFGAYEIRIDGHPVLTTDFRAAEYAEADVALGTHDLTPGVHQISFHPVVEPARPGRLSVEILRLLCLPPEAGRTERTHHEAHFIRLGIGRAIYAYRLAYDELPESLEQLVRLGIMSERYLKDENGVPLRVRREGEHLVVESPASPGWQHRWQGLDARR